MSKPSAAMTREEWLQRAIDKLRPDFMVRAGADWPERIRVSVGWPGSRGQRAAVTGECWLTGPRDRVPAVFISPALDDPVDILSTLVHELVHACGHRGHRGKFVTMAKAMGLEAPWPATKASDALKVRLHALARDLGDFDHSAIDAGLAGGRKQGTRMLKLECPACGYVVRTTQKWIAVGLPVCCCGDTMEPAA